MWIKPLDVQFRIPHSALPIFMGLAMADKPLLYIDYHAGTIKGPGATIGRLFATPKDKSWDAPPVATIVISNPHRLQQTVARLRQLGYPLVESSPPPPEATTANDHL
jgi:hypothetical protein